MKRILAWLFVLAMILSAAGCGADSGAGGDLLAQIQERGTITVAMEGNWAPWGYHDETDALKGYDADLARAIGEKLGVEVEFIEGEWDGLLSGMEAGRYDLVINGVESAAVLNAVVMMVKVASIVVFLLFCVISFKAGVFTEDFWGTAARNAAIMAQNGVELGGLGTQIVNCLLIMMWMFIGVEGACVMSARAERKSDVGKATIIGIVILLVLYIGASVLPYGVMPYEELIAAPSPATVTIFEYLAPGWGGAFLSTAIIISVLGSWLSFTMLPAETSSDMSNEHLLPASWNKMNAKGAPQMALIIVGACTQVFYILASFAEDTYTFAISMCTVTIIISWTLAALYQIKLGMETGDTKNLVYGVIAAAFQIVTVILSGWTFMLLACLGYIPGFIFYAQARREAGVAGTGLTKGELAAAVVICVLGIISVPMTFMGIIPVF